MSENEKNETLQIEDQENTEQSNKFARFAHLGKASKVVSKKKNKGLLGAFLGCVVLLLILMMIFSGHHKKQTTPQARQVATDSLIFKQNERRLEQLRKQRPVYLTDNNQGATAPAESKNMVARRNSPTQMYSAETPAKPADTAEASGNIMAGKDSLSQFANSQSKTASRVTGSKLQHPMYTVAEGELIPAVLETAVNSDLPGMLRAVTTRPIYAYLSEKPLIPAGSRLIGQYAAVASNGAATERVLVVWNRIITPSGISIMINSPGTDALGRAGVGANAVDTHFFKIFGTAALLSVMGATASNTGVSSTDQPNSADMYRQAIAESLQQSAQASLSQNLNIKPTLHIYQGSAVNVFVARDLDLYSVLGADQ